MIGCATFEYARVRFWETHAEYQQAKSAYLATPWWRYVSRWKLSGEMLRLSYDMETYSMFMARISR